MCGGNRIADFFILASKKKKLEIAQYLSLPSFPCIFKTVFSVPKMVTDKPEWERSHPGRKNPALLNRHT